MTEAEQREEYKLRRANNAIAQIKEIYEDYRDRGYHSFAEHFGEWYVALKDFVPPVPPKE